MMSWWALWVVVIVALFGALGGFVNGLMTAGGIGLPGTYSGTVKVAQNEEQKIQIIVLGVFGNMIVGVAAALVVYCLTDPGKAMDIIGGSNKPSLEAISLGVALLAGVGGAKTLEALVKSAQWPKFAKLPVPVGDSGTPLAALQSIAEPSSLMRKLPLQKEAKAVSG